ncbi:hypothetical protein DM860_003727 [Cuscuta australis]|uniref:Inositol polyphosphate multikinase n=1 Tax=Cuscuta australis TaxID=267555 RepID=A0A328DK50_9ASTE|nr:hypothetical protein DM860_003727 [Cuscuta australis]
MLKIPEHQVAGHQAHGGKLGPLVDDSGLFYKPLQGGDRGSHEVAFYTSFYSNPKIPPHIRRFFPKFHGTQVLEASDGSGLLSHLVLEDLTLAKSNPSIMDIKIGSRTWPPHESSEYIEKCLKKDRETSSISLGFRLSGLQMYVPKETGFWKPERKSVQNLSASEAGLVLRKFVSSNTSSDCSFASAVYGGPHGILSQLLELKAWFEDQTVYHFYSCSILMMYEKELASQENSSHGATIKMIDFAHVADAGGVIDHNFLGGLCSLIKFVSDILATPNDPTNVVERIF